MCTRRHQFVVSMFLLGLGLIAGCTRRGETLAAGAPRAGQVVGVFRLGDEVTNRATLKLRLELGPKAKPQELEVTGTWTATPTDAQDGLVQVASALSDVTVRLTQGSAGSWPGAGGMTRAEQEIATALAGTHFFESFRPDGAAAELWFPRGTNPAIGNLLITVASAQQLVRGPQPQPAWIVEERDANGRYLAAYRETTPGRYIKQKARYLETNPIRATGGLALASLSRAAGAGAAAGPVTRIKRSDFELDADGRGRVLGLRGLEVLSIDFEAAGMSMLTTVQLSLEDGRVTSAPDLVGAFARERAMLEVRPLEQMGLDAKAETARMDRAVLDGASFDELAKALAALPADADPAAGKDAATIARRFEAAFRLDDRAAARAPDLVRTQSAARAKLVLDALSLTATQRSSSALGSIAEDSATPLGLRQYAVQYLAHQPALSEEAVADVAALLDDRDPSLRQMARLTYGACAAVLRPSAPDRARRITDDLLARLGRAETGSPDQFDFLMALGNAGDAQALPVLRRLLTSGQPLRVRTNALDALRAIDSPDVDTLLVPELRGTEEPSVRLATIRAIRARDVGPFVTALADVACKDSDPQIRNAAIALLGDRMNALPTLRPILETVAKNDNVAGNRDLANRYLARAQTHAHRPVAN